MTGTTIVPILLLAVIQAAMCNNCSRICNPSEFFPDIKGNLTKIIWAHAVNSQAELEKALASEDVMMLEADVVIGRLNNTSGSNYTDIPIMAHPPAVESDLSLEEFLNITSINDSTILYFRYGKEFNITEGRYSTEQIKNMIDTLTENHVTQPVTYPVRAGLAANDINAIKALLKNTTFTNATLTIWSSEGDSVDAAQLSKLIKEVGINKVYVDVPGDLRRKLDLSAGSAMAPMVMNLGASLALLALSRML
ncbi:protein FAM151A [Pogonomyrmex barbatus]|uniref:Protein FAM151A n=1 Tax=Pogonomyrmex barbatus TaxID=144034 RepID=A0A6I9WAC3_9HYME|nr:protein FAM151A [Pogonomyrmex barbatus]